MNQHGIQSHEPLISVITVVYNARTLLERTLRSVAAQTYRNIEHLVIDGASTDGTVQLLEDYRNDAMRWKSEPDEGIYDAMNEGLLMAKGKYVWFVNAGDEIYERTTVEQILPLFEKDADVYYGESMFVDEKGKELGTRSTVTPHILPAALTWRHMRHGMAVSHQSIIVRRSLAPHYDLRHGFSSDIDWVIRVLKASRNTVHTGTVLSRYLIGGFSKKFHLKSLLDRYLILQKHFGILPNIVNHLYILFRGLKRGMGLK